MFFKKICNVTDKMAIVGRLNNFFYVFSLRQGTIVIAVHQIAISSLVLIILIVGITHVGEMLSMLHNDMEDDAERRGFYEVAYGKHVVFHEGDVVSTNNQLRFAKALHLASVTVIFLYTSTILTAMYLMCCISLLHGAIKNRREYILPWILASCIAVVMLIVAIVIADGYPCVFNLFGGHGLYQIWCTAFVLMFLYSILAVSSFAIELAGLHGRCARASLANDERGERLLLLDHAAHCSLLSAAQLNKLSTGTRTQFV